MLLRGNAGIEGHFNRRQYRLLIMMEHHRRENLDHFPITARSFQKSRLEALESLGEFGKGRTVP